MSEPTPSAVGRHCMVMAGVSDGFRADSIYVQVNHGRRFYAIVQLSLRMSSKIWFRQNKIQRRLRDFCNSTPLDIYSVSFSSDPRSSYRMLGV